MIYKSALVTEASGSIGGMTFSHNRGGQYIRQRVVPVNPNTGLQAVVRGIFADLSAAWTDDLTQNERDGWAEYSAAVPITNPLGDPVNIGGRAMYIRSNVARLQAALPRVDDRPNQNNIGSFTPVTIDNASLAAGTFDVNFDDTDGWVDQDDGGMLVYVSKSQNEAVNFFKGPFTFAGIIAGNQAVPPTTPTSFNFPATTTLGSKLFIRVNVARANGRYATQQIASTIVVV